MPINAKKNIEKKTITSTLCWGQLVLPPSPNLHQEEKKKGRKLNKLYKKSNYESQSPSKNISDYTPEYDSYLPWTFQRVLQRILLQPCVPPHWSPTGPDVIQLFEILPTTSQ